MLIFQRTAVDDVRLQCGYLSMPNAVMHSVTWTDMNMLDLGEDRNPPTDYEFTE